MSALNFRQPYAYISSNVTQAIDDTTLAQAVTFEINNALNKFTHSTSVNPERLYADDDGTYLFTVTGQLDLSAGASQTLDMWWRVNGTDVAYSNNSSFVTNPGDLRVLTKAELLVDLNRGDYVECVMSGSSISLRLLTVAAGVTPTRPAIPSVEIVAVRVSVT